MRCACCGGPLPPRDKSDGPRPKYCGHECQKEVWRVRARRRYHTIGDMERLLNDFDYIFPDYRGEPTWQIPLVRVPGSAMPVIPWLT